MLDGQALNISYGLELLPATTCADLREMSEPLTACVALPEIGNSPTLLATD